MIRVAFVSTTLAIGGAEIALLRLLKHMPKAYESHVISLSGLGDIGQRIAGLGIPVRALHLNASLPDPRALFQLSRHLRQIRPDVVQTWMYHADLLGGLAARLAGVPAIVWGIRNGTLEGPGTRWTTRAVMRLCAWLSRRIPTRIVSCSARACEYHVAQGYDRQKTVVIPNGVELSEFRDDAEARMRARAELGAPECAPMIGLIARFHPHKDHRTFIRAAGLLRPRYPQARFLLAGPGIDETNSQLRRWCVEAGVDRACVLLGTRTDVAKILPALDIVVSSSVSEAFPNVLAEAMACGVPCVATDVGDSAHILGDAGYVVPAGDAAALSGACQTLLELPVEARARLRQRARARVETHFDIELVARRYAALYHDAANARP